MSTIKLNKKNIVVNKMKTKTTCKVCNIQINTSSMLRHEKSKKHLKLSREATKPKDTMPRDAPQKALSNTKIAVDARKLRAKGGKAFRDNVAKKKKEYRARKKAEKDGTTIKLVTKSTSTKPTSRSISTQTEHDDFAQHEATHEAQHAGYHKRLDKEENQSSDDDKDGPDDDESPEIVDCDDLLNKLPLKNPHKPTQPPATRASISQYVKGFQRHYAAFTGNKKSTYDCKDLDWLDPPRKFIAWIDGNIKKGKWRPNTGIAALINVSAILGRLPSRQANRLHKVFSELSTKRSQIEKEKVSQGNFVTAKSKANFIPYNILQGFVRDMPAKTHQQVEYKTLASLYTEIAPRRVMDYQLMKFIPKGVSLGNAKKLSKDFNYIAMDRFGVKVKFIVFNKFKTSSGKNSYIVNSKEIPAALSKVLNVYIRQKGKVVPKNGKFLFSQKKNDKELAPSAFSKLVKTAFNTVKGIGDRSITPNDLRHSYMTMVVSSKRLTLSMLKKESVKVGNSPLVFLSYVRRLPVKERGNLEKALEGTNFRGNKVNL